MGKLIAGFFLLVVVSLVVADYDFQDSDFIEVKQLRVRRGTKEKKDIHCCSGEGGNLQEIEAAKEVKNKCIAEIRGDNETDDERPIYDPLSCETVQAMREKTVCAAECIVKKLDLLDVNGTFKRDALLNHSSKLIGESNWKASVLETYLDECLSSLKPPADVTKSEKPAVAATEAAGCNPAPLDFHHCMWRKFVEGCPVESQIGSKKCRKIRERLAKGDTSYAEKTFKKLFKHPKD